MQTETGENMLTGSWAFTGQARENVNEGGKAKGRMNRNASLSKKIIFNAGLKLCETKFSGGLYSPGSLAHKQKQNEITNELSWSENRLQGAEEPGTADTKKDQKHGNMALPGLRHSHSSLEEGGP